MRTFWVRIYCSPLEVFHWIDAFLTGETDEQHIMCFAVRAEHESDVENLLMLAMKFPFEVSFIEERPWSIFRDFAGSNKRFRMSEKYLDEAIDTVEACMIRVRERTG